MECVLINVLVVSEFNVIKELLRSALKMQKDIVSIRLSTENELRSFKKACFNSRGDVLNIVFYDLDSIKETPSWKMDRMIDTYISMQNKKIGMSSLVILSSEGQLSLLRRKVTFIDEGSIIKKPFTFKQIIQVVNNIWTSNITC